MGESYTSEMELKNDLSLLDAAALNFIQSDLKMLIGAEALGAQSGKTFDILDPTSGDVIASVPEGAAADIDLAVIEARRAFETGAWSKMKPASREKLIFQLADLLDKNAQELSNIESINSGYRNLDLELPHGSWPKSCLIEILSREESVSEIILLLPTLKKIVANNPSKSLIKSLL